MDPSTRLALFGTDERELPALLLRAGPLTLRLQGVHLRAWAVDGHEVLHGVAFLFRDVGWGTPEPVVDRCDWHQEGDGFVAVVEAHVPVEPRIDLRMYIVGDAAGRVRCEGVAVPRGDIETQRLGLCVMYPMSLAGHEIEVAHDDGRLARSTFPCHVPPWPPFTQVRRVRHAYAPGAWASCTLQGDSFELEDQRNNADASFKLYSRSNQMPRPYRLRGGVAVTQVLEIGLEGRPASAPVVAPPALALGAWLERAPVVGVGLAAADLAAGPDCVARLDRLAPVQLHLVMDTVQDALDMATLARCVAASGRPLRLDVRHATRADADDVGTLAQRLRERAIPIDTVAMFPATPEAVDILRGAFPGAAVGGGTPYFFAQANRIDDLGAVNFIGFTVSAIVHAADDASPMQGLQCLPSLIDTLRSRHPGLGIRVGPSAIAAPRSPLGPQPASDGLRRMALARRDPRSGAVYGAAWLVGHLGALVSAQAQAVSVRGLGDDDGLFIPEAAPRPTPAGWVLRELRDATRFRSVRCSDPAAVAALAFERRSGGTVVLAANLGPSTLRLRVDAPTAGDAHRLDACSWTDCREGRRADPWQRLDAEPDGHWALPPYATVRLASR